MNDKIIKTINEHKLISKGDTVLIAFSGGADSVFLADFLVSIRDEYNLTLKAAHIEHGIRGSESLADCAFVESFCAENDIECHTLHINAPVEAKKAGMTVEEYSRYRRYNFFYTIECNCIATAHNKSDNAETALFRLARGTSVKGMCGIPFKRGKIVRPLLEISGAEIRSCLDEKGVSYCVDSTNSDNKYSRNHIRNNIIPAFEKINSDFENAVVRLIHSNREDSDYLERASWEAFDEIFNDNALDISLLRNCHISILKRVIIRYFAEFNLCVDEYHLNEAVKLVFSPSRTQLNGDFYAVSDSKTFRVVNEKRKKSIFIVEKAYFCADEFLNKCELFTKKFDFYCDCDKIVGNISVRSRENGDKITPANRRCTKTLKKLYNELGIPAERRADIPLIVDDFGVIGIYGYCVDERVKADASTKNILAVSISTEDNV